MVITLFRLGSLISAFAIIVSSLKFVYKFQPVSVEVERKVMHICTGLCLLTLPWIFQSWVVVAILISAIVIGPFFVAYIPWANRTFGRNLQVKRKNIGGPLFGLAFLLLFILAKDYKVFYLISALVLIFADSFAAIIGTKYPWHSFGLYSYQKTLSGSLTFLGVAFLCLLLPLLIFTPHAAPWMIMVSLFIAVVVTMIEAIMPFGLDNLVIPLAVFYLLRALLMHTYT